MRVVEVHLEARKVHAKTTKPSDVVSPVPHTSDVGNVICIRQVARAISFEPSASALETIVDFADPTVSAEQTPDEPVTRPLTYFAIGLTIS